jgi:hypothetical protein
LAYTSPLKTNIFLRNVGWLSTDYKTPNSQNINVFTLTAVRTSNSP